MGAPASFTDDTSLPHAGCVVSIHAQIIPENSFHWYFFLRSKASEGRGEFKKDAIDTFFNIAELDRQQITKTMRNVRIHITDPRPYAAYLAEPLRKILPRGTTVQGFLKRLDDSTQHLKDLQDKTIKAVAQQMLRDSPSERLKYKFKVWEYINEIRLAPIRESTLLDFQIEPKQTARI